MESNLTNVWEALLYCFNQPSRFQLWHLKLWQTQQVGFEVSMLVTFALRLSINLCSACKLSI